MGSSPRMRGTRGRSFAVAGSRGLIPTYAGNTSPRAKAYRSRRAHPHVCGEHAAALITPAPPPGSSPRMRGTPRKRSHRTGTGRAHPHVCGEHTGENGEIEIHPGSSPRMRGTLVWGAAPAAGFGLIPTYAGNTTALSHSTGTNRAHPHVCGEHMPHTRTSRVPSGSSPRMRETHYPHGGF